MPKTYTMRLRVRGPSGSITITLSDTATWGDLKRDVSEKTSVPDFDLKHGYPPQTLDSAEFGDDVALTDLGVKLDGEQLTVVPRNISTGASISGQTPNPRAVGSLPSLDQIDPPKHQPGDFPNDPASTEQHAGPLSLTRKPNPTLDSDPPEIPVPNLEGTLVLRVMPDDNSCMFRALGAAVLGDALDAMTELRSIVAQTIQANPDLYSCLLYTSPSPRDGLLSRMPSSA